MVPQVDTIKFDMKEIDKLKIHRGQRKVQKKKIVQLKRARIRFGSWNRRHDGETRISKEHRD